MGWFGGCICGLEVNSRDSFTLNITGGRCFFEEFSGASFGGYIRGE